MNWKCRMKGLMVFWAVLRNIYLKREGLRVPVTIVWPLEAFCCSSHIWGELRSLWVDGHNSYEPVIYIYCIYNDIFDLAQGSVTKMKNLTRMMSSFLTLTGLCACLFFSLFFFPMTSVLFCPVIPHSQKNFTHVISVRFSKFKCLFFIVETTQRGPKMH